MKRLTALVLAVICLLSISACGQEPTVTTPSTEPIGTTSEPTDPVVKEMKAVYNLVPGRAYKFGLLQEVMKNTVYYLTGTMEGSYMATTEDVAAAADVYVERVGAGYHLYTVQQNTKQYINVLQNETRVFCQYEPTASTVYIFKHGTLFATIDGEEYLFGVRDPSPYTTIGVRKAEEDSYICQFYREDAPDEWDWLLGSWESVIRTEDKRDEWDGFTRATLSTLDISFGADGSGSIGCGAWSNWDDGNGCIASQWVVPGMGYPSEFFSYSLEGNTLYITYLGADVEEYDPYTVAYTVSREGNFIILNNATGAGGVVGDVGDLGKFVDTDCAKNLEELCKAFGVDYSLPQN